MHYEPFKGFSLPKHDPHMLSTRFGQLWAPARPDLLIDSPTHKGDIGQDPKSANSIFEGPLPLQVQKLWYTHSNKISNNLEYLCLTGFPFHFTFDFIVVITLKLINRSGLLEHLQEARHMCSFIIIGRGKQISSPIRKSIRTNSNGSDLFDLDFQKTDRNGSVMVLGLG